MRQLVKADEELVDWGTSAIGVRAQGYEGGSSGHAFDSHEAHTGRLMAMRWLDGRPGARERWDAIAGTLMALDAPRRRVLEMVYRPRGVPAWLADALAVPWGGGSLVMLASTLPRASAAAKGASTLDWMQRQGRGGSTSLFKRLREEAERMRVDALRAYEILRVERVKDERAVTDSVRAIKEAERLRLLEEELGAKRRRSNERLDARMRRVG